MANDLSKSELGEELLRIDPDLVKGLNRVEREKLGKALLRVQHSVTLSVQQQTHPRRAGRKQCDCELPRVSTRMSDEKREPVRLAMEYDNNL